jgi:hypothetical protein
VGLATIFYCLRCETSLFVASYDSQGHGGGIRPRLHTGSSQFPFPYSLTSSRHGPRTENIAPLLLHSADHTKNMCHVSDCEFIGPLPARRGADDIETTASSIVACWKVFTELLPGNALIKSNIFLRSTRNSPQWSLLFSLSQLNVDKHF